jgi:hypothetical protein
MKQFAAAATERVTRNTSNVGRCAAMCPAAHEDRLAIQPTIGIASAVSSTTDTAMPIAYTTKRARRRVSGDSSTRTGGNHASGEIHTPKA